MELKRNRVVVRNLDYVGERMILHARLDLVHIESRSDLVRTGAAPLIKLHGKFGGGFSGYSWQFQGLP